MSFLRHRAGAVLFAACVALATTACAGGERPVLVDASTVPTATDIGASLPPAPAGTQPLTAPDASAVPQPSIDDALNDWTRSAGIAYDGRCGGSALAGDWLCSSASNDPNVMFLGPTATELWHVVTLRSTPEGFTVVSTKLAGS